MIIKESLINIMIELIIPKIIIIIFNKLIIIDIIIKIQFKKNIIISL